MAGELRNESVVDYHLSTRYARQGTHVDDNMNLTIALPRQGIAAITIEFVQISGVSGESALR